MEFPELQAAVITAERTFRKGNTAVEKVTVRLLDSLFQDEYETKWGVRVVHPQSLLLTHQQVTVKEKRKDECQPLRKWS